MSAKSIECGQDLCCCCYGWVHETSNSMSKSIIAGIFFAHAVEGAFYSTIYMHCSSLDASIKLKSEG